MANTYTQIHIQFVFVVQYRKTLIKKEWKDLLYKYITGIIQNKEHKLLQINGMPDHVHILLGMRPYQSISELAQVVKKQSSDWINEMKFTERRFNWQPGFGAFSYSKNDVPRVIRYIANQEQHHRKISFSAEYIKLLEEMKINYDENYLFDPIL